MAHWEHYPHEADMGIRGIGISKDEAFEQAGLALTAVIVDPALVLAQQSLVIHCNSSDREVLFLDWLNAIIFEMAYRNMLFSRFKVKIEGDSLTADISGEYVDVKRHQPAVEIKGATFTTLKVEQLSNGIWIAQTVVDV